MNIIQKIIAFFLRKTDKTHSGDVFTKLRKDMAEGYLSKDEERYISELEREYHHMKAKIKQIENEDLNKRLITEYPTRSIYYYGRYLPLSKDRIKFPVQVMITPEDPHIIKDLKSWGLYRSDEDFETLIPKIYKRYMRKHYKYKYDKDNWGGLNEFWEFPFELYAKYGDGKWEADCDSHAIALVSYLRAAGIPAGFIWVVAGNCRLGGHATLYCYSKKTDKFHHLNSTSRIYKERVSDYPTHKDAEEGNDDMGIYDVWLSFNDLIARSEFSKKDISNLIVRKQ